MKSLLKFFVYVFAFTALSVGSYHVILSSGLISGLAIATAILLLCTVLFSISIYALAQGKFTLFRIGSTGEAAGLMIFSVLLFAVAVTVAGINSYVEYSLEASGLSHTEKTRLFTSSVLQIPTQKSLQIESRNGVEYYHTEENKDAIEKFDQLLGEKRSEFNDFFGTRDSGGLAIEFHEEYSSLEASGGMEAISGFYNWLNRTIHLVPDDPYWEVILIHEYAHYHSQLFAEKHGLDFNRTPQWFEEGMADYLADDVPSWMELESLEILDFRNLDDPENFDAASTEFFDPYAQSGLAVASIAEAHGEERIIELLQTESINDFYSRLEAITEQDFATFQETFLDQMIIDQQAAEEKFNKLMTAIEMEQFAEAERYAGEIQETGSAYEADEAMGWMVEIYLLQGQFEKAQKYVEHKIAEDNSLFLIDDLLFLSEVYLLTDTEKALEYHLAAKQEAEAADEADYYDFGLTVPVYEKINSVERLAGFTSIIEEKFIFDLLIEEQLIKQLRVEYPGKF